MAKITVKLECENCLEEFQKELTRDARNNFSIKNDIITDAVNAGWHVGASTLCPECRMKVIRKCRTCIDYEDKSMCAPACRKRGITVMGDDFCNGYSGSRETDGLGREGTA